MHLLLDAVYQQPLGWQPKRQALVKLFVDGGGLKKEAGWLCNASATGHFDAIKTFQQRFWGVLYV